MEAWDNNLGETRLKFDRIVCETQSIGSHSRISCVLDTSFGAIVELGVSFLTDGTVSFYSDILD